MSCLCEKNNNITTLFKTNKMKKIFLLTAVIVLTIAMFTACEPKEEPQGSGYTITADGTIKGKLKLVKNKKLTGEVTDQIDSIEVYIYKGEANLILLKKDTVNNGSFEVMIPVPPDSCLIDITLAFNNATINDKTAKISSNLKLQSLKDSQQNGTIKRLYSDLSGPLQILYASKAVNITGNYSLNQDGFEYKYIYDIRFNAGWNTLEYKMNITGGTINVTITANSDPINMLWTLELDE